MLIGVIADDFTGASDIANTLAKGGGGPQASQQCNFSAYRRGPPIVNARRV